MAALLVEADGRPFAIPLDRVERTVRLADQTVRSVAGQRMLVLRDGVLPLLDGAEALGGAAGAGRRVRRDRPRPATVASPSPSPRLVGQRELVTRPLPPEVADGAAAVRRRRAVRRPDRPDRRLRRGRPDRRVRASIAA